MGKGILSLQIYSPGDLKSLAKVFVQTPKVCLIPFVYLTRFFAPNANIMLILKKAVGKL